MSRSREDARARIVNNPFSVLGLPATATRAEIEREGTKLLGMLELGLASARVYPTPFGPRTRTPEQVREAMAALRDPAQRARHEPWVIGPELAASLQLDAESEGRADAEARLAPFDALTALGWRRRT